MTKRKTKDQREYQKVKVYTKTGDKGITSLFGGKRVPKFSLRIEAVGTVDELSSAIGVVIAEIQKSKGKSQTLPAGRQDYSSKVKKMLNQVQHDLFDIGASIANPNPKYPKETSEFLEKRVQSFEKLIDKMAEVIPDFQCFILPGVGKTGSQLHVCRTIARRAERRIIELSENEKVTPDIIVYMNRLSDLLFTMARFINFKEKKKETIWQLQF
ncbi:MAG: ATP:cob(I)alamin adenosyltransferase [Candidatus Levybacteria bacterium RIFCSPHIGHO2_12_FULL_38_12]|nr:MAG: ATP:cob(I)alamin adenosyltransferase [Candidatus Levybacteria bacterium RIFCSPHIGHO2_12_FULL_38_12]OGH44224.1 MAG: ATP:cob(I)alamin adenosyltransferase [Candidatus Levybacteria bacterium RIFCSPLOWO2_02_FULL_37_18]OGH51455.1 MAG: ATP:cob(I)alamin adenosyltransferase [Candidatus Levybacteria bacterium RIFCSPLOWO2_12_FULL_37_7]